MVCIIQFDANIIINSQKYCIYVFFYNFFCSYNYKMEPRVVQIEPLQVVTVSNKCSFNVRIMHMTIFESVSIIVNFFDENNNRVDTVSLTLTGEDYSNWGSDDNYLYNYVAQKYGTKIKEPVAEPVTEVVE